MHKNVLPLNVRNYIDGGEKEEKLRNVIAKFFCPRNIDVENFLKSQAIDFTKKNQSVSYLVFSAETGEALGYYTVAIKPISVKADRFSNSMNKKIARVSDYDDRSGTYTLSAYLIAQIGKNYANWLSEEITGTQLLQCALDTIKELQYSAGGMVYFLEAEKEERLIKFYEDNGFKKFDTRKTKPESEEPHELIQLLKII